MSRPFLFLVTAAVPLVLYARTISFDFVRADDLDLIAGNQAFLSDLGNLPATFTRSYFEVEGDLVQQKTYYRPVAIASFMLDAARAGADPSAYHLTNVVLHAAVACLLLLLARTWGASWIAALAAALVFAAHPVNAQAVAWIAGRNDLLMALFGLVSLVAWTNGSPALHTVAFAAAVFSKETGFLFLALALAHQGLVLRSPLTRAHKIALAVDVAVVVVWVVLRSRALAGMPSELTWDTLRVIATNAPQILVHLRKVLFPIWLNVAPGVQDRDLLMAALALIVFGIAASRYLSAALTTLASAWVLLFLAPTLMVPGLPAYQHRMYLPLIGLLVVLAMAAAPGKKMPYPVAAIVIVLGVMTWTRLDVFRNPVAYWTDAARDPVFGPLAHVNLGQLHEADGRLGEARREYLRALERDPNTPKAHNNLGVVFMKLDQPERALPHFEAETTQHPWNADAWFNLGLFEELRGNEAAARQYYERAIVANPAYRPAYEKLGRTPLAR